jgi:hypothetical protein
MIVTSRFVTPAQCRSPGRSKGAGMPVTARHRYRSTLIFIAAEAQHGGVCVPNALPLIA